MPEFDGLSYLDQLDEQLAGAVGKFGKQVSAATPQIFKRLEDLVSRLDKTGAGTIPRRDMLNVKVINQIRSEIKGAITGSDYPAAVADFLKDFESVASPINRYFSAVVGEHGSGKTYDELQRVYMEATADALTGTGLEAEFERPIFNIIRESVIQGVSSSVIKENLKNYVLEDPNFGGDVKALNTYAGQISDDAINQYSRNMIEAHTADLGLKHYFFKGTIIRTSRAFCDRRVGKYFTEEEVLVWGKQAQEAELAGRRAWAGVYRGTNPVTIKVFLGGYRCRHRLAPITEDLFNLRTENGTKNRLDPNAPLEAKKLPESASKEKKKAKAKAAPAPAKPAKATGSPAAKTVPAVEDLRLRFRPAGMDPKVYGLDTNPDFWAKLPKNVNATFDPKDGSYHVAPIGDGLSKVQIEKGSNRWEKSPYFQKAIVYHEYGHAIHTARGIVNRRTLAPVEEKFAAVFAKAKATTRGKLGDAMIAEADKLQTYVSRKRLGRPDLPELDLRLKGIADKLSEIDPADYNEMKGDYMDTLQALTKGRIGYGHELKYCKSPLAGEAEFFAHAMENAFAGNTYFELVNPDLFNMMKEYALNL